LDLVSEWTELDPLKELPVSESRAQVEQVSPQEAPKKSRAEALEKQPPVKPPSSLPLPLSATSNSVAPKASDSAGGSSPQRVLGEPAQQQSRTSIENQRKGLQNVSLSPTSLQSLAPSLNETEFEVLFIINSYRFSFPHSC